MKQLASGDFVIRLLQGAPGKVSQRHKLAKSLIRAVFCDHLMSSGITTETGHGSNRFSFGRDQSFGAPPLIMSPCAARLKT